MSRKKRATLYPHVISFRVDDATKDKINEAAALHDLEPGPFARWLIIRSVEARMNLPSVKRKVANREILSRVLTELMRQGNNLNQIARNFHTSAGPDIAQQALSLLEAHYANALRAVETALTGNLQR